MKTNTYSTNRLKIRKLKESDILVWESFFVNNPSLVYLGLDITKSPYQNAKEWIELQFKRYEEKRGGHHALIEKETGNFVGMCGLLTQEVEGKQENEIAYSLLQKYWGKGYASEASQLFRDLGFEKENLDRIISIVDIRNIASQKVAVRNGMLIDRQIKYHGLDVNIYKITRDEWEILQNS